jgi:hypothetical protein
MKNIVKAAALVLIAFSMNANASFILNGNPALSINTISINESFDDFYGYSQNIINSSNTGLEETNTGVFSITQFNGNFALIATFGAFLSDGDKDGGSFDMNVVNNGLGSFLFIDDPDEIILLGSNVTDISFKYFKNRTDGFIFDLGNGFDIDLTFNISNTAGLDNLKMLNGGSEYVLGNEFRISSLREVPEPTSLVLLSLFLLGLVVRKRA